MDATARLELQRPDARSLRMLAALVVLVPTLVAAAALLLSRDPATGGAIGIVALVLVVSLAVYALIATLAARGSIRATREGLELRSAFYRVRLRRDEIDAAGIRAVDGAKGSPYALAWRTNGVAFPGFQAGWFRTRSRERAFVVRSGTRCVAIPTTKGFVVLLGADDAGRAAQALKTALG
jgi:hypothetical protein